VDVAVEVALPSRRDRQRVLAARREGRVVRRVERRARVQEVLCECGRAEPGRRGRFVGPGRGEYAVPVDGLSSATVVGGGARADVAVELERQVVDRERVGDHKRPQRTYRDHETAEEEPATPTTSSESENPHVNPQGFGLSRCTPTASVAHSTV